MYDVSIDYEMTNFRIHPLIAFGVCQVCQERAEVIHITQ